ncbi:hypothetical protein SAY87_005883 [Trapa incisa]|uniref:Probable 6-phosphogluconolactonase n=2 Tax=Trapa TaxID=22665 RepID=A0AAN7KZJ8_TRANT|nr:hypothetical protein SAY87_005883 [Trapa incisa]KAK4771862.1 hypothetical protein SAY86_013637 [Trapa natans]
MAAVSTSVRSLPSVRHLRLSRLSPTVAPGRLSYSTGIRAISPICSVRSRRSDYRARFSASAMAESSKAKVEVHDSEEVLAASLAKYTADLSSKFVGERGAFTFVVSGGSLIKSLRKLTEPPYVDSIDWSKWHVFWVDERVVPKDHDDSNYKLAYDGFLSKVPILPGNVYSINDALSAEGAADDYETCLKHLVKSGVINISEARFPKFDLMLLGMGPDGHVASLFPGHVLINEKVKWVTFIKDSPKPPPERITFTFPVINSSAYIALVVAGAGKAHVVQTALGDSQSSEKLPVQLVSPEGELTWFLDKGAASML